MKKTRIKRSRKAPLNQALASLHLEKHPGKTFIGLIVRGFDFLGYHFQPQSDLSPLLTIARQTFANFIEKASQLYEQKRGKPGGATALEMYVRRNSVCLQTRIRTKKQSGPAAREAMGDSRTWWQQCRTNRRSS